MQDIHDIKKPVQPYLDAFEDKFRKAMSSKVPLLDTITRYIIKRKGKLIRPIIVFNAAGMHGEINESTYRAAALIELLHTATLIHDDVVDDSDRRRGFFSINALWKNKIAVLVGDYLLSKGLLVAIENEEFDLLKIVSVAVREMSEGELLQISKIRNFTIDEKVYLEIVRKKTATLLAACCACGAASIVNKKETIDKMYKLGELIGMAFQIKDDLLDYEGTNKTGKPLGNDIKEQKITLPLIYTLQQLPFLDKKKMIYNIKRHHKNKHKMQEITKKIIETGGCIYAHEQLQSYQNQALACLDAFPETPFKSNLKQIIEFIVQREH